MAAERAVKQLNDTGESINVILLYVATAGVAAGLVQFLLLLQGDHNIAMALTQSALQQQELQIRKMKQQHMRTSMSVACRARKAGQQQLAQQRLVLDRQLCLQMASSLCASVTTQSQLLGMVVILLQHMSAAQQQLGASLCTQERLQNDALRLKRALAEAQQRKQAAETKVKTLKQEGKALAVALKTVASMLVDKSEQKAHLSASVSCVVEQCASASQLLQAQQAQQPPTPSIASTSSSRPPSLQAPGTHAALADHNPVTQDLPGLTDQDTISDAQVMWTQRTVPSHPSRCKLSMQMVFWWLSKNRSETDLQHLQSRDSKAELSCCKAKLLQPHAAS